MKSVQIDALTEDLSELKLVDCEIPEPGPGQVRVRMLMASVNPSDLNYIHGSYRDALARLLWNRGRDPVCFDPARSSPCPLPPYALGNEGVGIVDACGSGLLARRLRGKRVAISAGPPMGAWQEYTVVDARRAMPVPAELDDAQAAMYIINPLSAYAMVRDVLKVQRGAWLLQDAAGSALAKMVIRLGRLDGFRTINIVRSQAYHQELKTLGADVIIDTSSQNLLDEVATATGGRGVEYAMDCVGGELAGQMLQCLTIGGHMVVYGTLGDAPIPLPSRDMMMPVTRLSGFYAPGWLAGKSPLQLLGAIRQLGKLSRQGIFQTPVLASYPLAEVATAVAASLESGRQGKVLLKIAD